MHHQNEACIEACLACLTACEHCATHDLHEGVEMSACALLCRDCAEECRKMAA